MNRRGRLVYSTGPGGDSRRTACPRCGDEPCSCEPCESLPPEAQQVRVRRDRSGRKGKTVTVCSPLLLVRSDAKELLRELKTSCGGGGTLKQTRDRRDRPCFQLEIQGDHVEPIVERLRELGYPAKRSGG